MTEKTLLNQSRPPVFCPGCAHENVVKALDRALVGMGAAGHEVALVSDIGCSGLFDTFFHTHAFHGLHGRALTYATGIKLCRPELKVIVTMGDGGLGIGGAHLLAACRRNLDITLLVLNNFNFGMTGGQCSATTPAEADVNSGFLNRLERPMDLQALAAAAGAPYVAALSAYDRDLPPALERAIRYHGFSIVEIQGVCPGRYSRRNRLTPADIKEALAGRTLAQGDIRENARPEYGEAYRREARALNPASRPRVFEARFTPPRSGPVIAAVLGAAGRRIITAGEVLAIAGMLAGLNVTQKNEYNITVLRGPSITELRLSPEPVHYTGIENPDLVLALADEGVERRRNDLERLTADSLVIADGEVNIPETRAEVVRVDFKGRGVKKADRALAALAVAADMKRVLHRDMLCAALEERFSGQVLRAALGVVRGMED